MRCPDCNKFVAFEEMDPEVDLSVDEDANVSAEIRIVNSCAECGTELKEATFDLEQDKAEECGDHIGEGHSLEIEEEDPERDQKSEGSKNPRYAKTFYGFRVAYVISCGCSEKEPFKCQGELSDYVQASGMDELT